MDTAPTQETLDDEMTHFKCALIFVYRQRIYNASRLCEHFDAKAMVESAFTGRPERDLERFDREIQQTDEKIEGLLGNISAIKKIKRSMQP